MINLLIVLLFFCTNIFGQTDNLEVKKVILNDGSEFVGTIIYEDEEKIIIKTKSGVKAEFEKNLVKEIKLVVVKSGDVFGRKYRPGDHELLIMPTAYTMEAGQWYLSDYELFFLNFTFLLYITIF